LIQRPELDQRGLMIVGLHLGSFDLVMQWICKQGMRPLVLTIPDPHGGRRIEYEMRKKSGIHLIPASVGAFRQAVKHLQQGGMVLTGIDRPIPNPRTCPRFFGRPAALPIHPIFLAIKAHVPLIIAGTYLQEDRKYHVFASDLIEMDSYPNAETATLRNAEKVLNVAELFIRRAPHQWCVPLSVWPEMMAFVPK
jgi:lauroyl/myristoyl acyltransferase